jgi:bacteriocin-like protein
MAAMHELSAAELAQVEGGSFQWGVGSSPMEQVSLNFAKVSM